MKIVDLQVGLQQYAGPGHWNDPDMLEVGNGMSASEDRAHFSMWCILAAPLMAGNDIRSMSKETVGALTNKDVVAIDQDALGIEGFRYSKKEGLEAWFKPLQNGEWAVCFVNRNKDAVKINFNWKSESVTDPMSKASLDAAGTTYKLKDLWTKKNLGTTQNALTAEVPAHDVLMLRLSK